MRRITVILTVMISAVYLAAGAVSLPTLTEISIPTKHFIAAGSEGASDSRYSSGINHKTTMPEPMTPPKRPVPPQKDAGPRNRACMTIRTPPTRSMRDWNRLWANTAVLMGGGLTALGILNCFLRNRQHGTVMKRQDPVVQNAGFATSKRVRYGTVTNLFSTLCSTPMPAPPTT